MHKIGILFLFFMLAGCDNSSGNSAIIGSWVTDACQQLTGQNSQPVNVWVKSTYTFDVNGNIYIEPTSYSDSNCITKSNAIQAESFLAAIFTEQGPATTSQGIEANKITITFDGAPPPTVSTSGYYKITNNQLCLSEAFHFGAGSFSINQVDDIKINFIDCLTKK